MSATTLLIVNGICSFVGAAVGAWLGVRGWFKREAQKDRAEDAHDF
jgi:hypothetical protein